MALLPGTGDGDGRAGDLLRKWFIVLEAGGCHCKSVCLAFASNPKSAVNDLAGAFKQLEDMSKQIKDIGGTTGINLEKLYEVSKDKKDDITYIKNKSEELKAAMEINKKLLEDQNKKPVVHSWFEFK